MRHTPLVTCWILQSYCIWESIDGHQDKHPLLCPTCDPNKFINKNKKREILSISLGKLLEILLENNFVTTQPGTLFYAVFHFPSEDVHTIVYVLGFFFFLNTRLLFNKKEYLLKFILYKFNILSNLFLHKSYFLRSANLRYFQKHVCWLC